MENYSGNKDPFVFIAYGKEDEAQAKKAAEAIAEKAKVFLASEFGAKEKKILDKASLFVPVISAASAPGLEEAVSRAAAAGKDLLPVFLEMPELSPGMSMLLGTTQGHLKQESDDEDSFLKALKSSPALSGLKVSAAQKKASRNTLIAAICAFVVVVAAVLVIALKPFAADRIDKDSALGQLGLSGSASSIKKVYLYGNSLEKNFETGGAIQSVANTASDLSSLYLPVADKMVALGTLTDLSDFAQLTNLEELSLAGNSVTEISQLLSLKKLKKLDLSDQHYDENDPRFRGIEGLSLAGISQLTSLEYINLAYNNLEEAWAATGAEELKSMPNLKTVVLERGSMLAEQLAGASFEIVYTGTEVKNYEELKAAAADKNCHEIDIAPGSVITIPAGEEFTLPKNVGISGGDHELRNYGTIHIKGWVECRAQEYNDGVIIVEDGGYWVGGMSEIYNNGTFTIAKGGFQSFERGKHLENKGTYTVEGVMFLGFGGRLDNEGGRLVNNGKIQVQNIPAGFDMLGQEWQDQRKDIISKFTGGGSVEYVDQMKW